MVREIESIGDFSHLCNAEVLWLCREQGPDETEASTIFGENLKKRERERESVRVECVIPSSRSDFFEQHNQSSFALSAT